ncbi:MAG: DUF1926 domain-containing protein [Chloroflexi bacterium]|nr:DUF1926 domain-containing protein [Chloroflexota bacterium]
MNRLYLGLAIHNHQPVGNFPWVFHAAYQDAYLPMIQALEAHPGVRLALHYSGPLLDWLREQRPELLKRVARLAGQGQVELMTGGYYEPILPAIPHLDQVGQVRKMTQVLAQELGQQATGLWLAERVWEPYLPRALAEAGVGWTLVDDSHFQMVGMDEGELLGYYLTEHEGHAVKIFPSLKALRYSIPWHDVDAVLGELREMSQQGDDLIAVMGDDGEKFGVWPTTRQHCWDRGWVDRFFAALEANGQWLTTIPLGEYAQRHPPLGRIYLPTASYPELMEWALPPERSREYELVREEMEQAGRQEVVRYLRGSFWRAFLAKYPEANALHKKMLRVHRKVYQALSRAPEGAVLSQSKGADAGQDELWQGQCNCPYWHGVFGGLYLTDVRAAAHHHLIAAENQADAILHAAPQWLEASAEDYDQDGYDELLLESDALCLYLKPQEGGGIVQWDARAQRFNLQSTLARRPEAYHLALVQGDAHQHQEDYEATSIHAGVRTKEPGLARQLYYDPLPRLSMVERFLPAETTLEELQQARHRELGDFAGRPYQWEQVNRDNGIEVRLWRTGQVQQEEQALPVEVSKRLRLTPGSSQVEVVYTLANRGDAPLRATFASEWNVNLLGGGHNPAAFLELSGKAVTPPHLDAAGELVVHDSLALVNRGLDLRLELRPSGPLRAWRYPVESVSNSEGGLERIYQATCLTLLLELELAAGQAREVSLLWQTGPASVT